MSASSFRARRALALAALVTAAAAVTPERASAVIKTWVGPDNGNWSLTTNWSGSTVPAAGDDVLMGATGSGSSLTANLNLSPPALNSLKLNANASLVNFTLSQTGSAIQAITEVIGDTFSGNTYAQAGGTNSVTNLILGNTTGGAGTYALSFIGTLNAANVTVGNAGTGSGNFSQTGGTANVSSHFVVGGNGSFSNQANFSGGTLNLTTANADIVVGAGTGSAVFSQSGGTVNAANNTIYIANSPSTLGTYALSGTGTLNANTVYVGNSNSGTFGHTGGTANVASLYLGSGVATSVGTYNLTSASATLSTTSEFIGYTGRGTFTQTAGTNTANYVEVGSGAATTGTYTLGGGTLNLVGNSFTNYGTLVVGAGSSHATFTQTGGTVSAANGLIQLGTAVGAVGTYAMKGGSVTADTVAVGEAGFLGTPGGSGSFVQSGGTLTATGSYRGLVVGGYQSAGGSYSLTNTNAPATLNAYVETIGGGSTSASFVQDAGTTHNVTGTLSLGSGYTTVNNYYTLYGGALNADTFNIGNGGNGTFLQYNGIVSISSALNVGLYYAAGTTASYTLGSGTLTTTGLGRLNTLPGGTLTQFGGTLSGTVVNGGTFVYGGGNFAGVLDNQPTGTLTYYSSPSVLTAGQGVVNRGTITLAPGCALGAGVGYALDNQAVLTLAGGSLSGPGALANNATLTGWGTITGSGGFTNNDSFAQGAGTLVIANTGSNVNYGAMYLMAGRQVQVISNLTNAGSLAVGSALVTGTGTLTNGAAGLLVGPGTVSVNSFSNAGTLLAPAGTTRVTPNFTNSGLIQLNDVAASVTGGTVSNTGSIQGVGKVANSVNNAGTITSPAGGTLTLAGPVTNAGLLLVPTGSKLLVSGAFASNAGTITLQGGTFDTNNQALANNSVIAGYGTVTTGGLTNNASITFTGGNTTVTGPVTNAAGKTIEVRFNPALFTGAVVNNGTLKVTGTTVTFAGSYAGTPPSEPGGVAGDAGAQAPGGMDAANDGGLTGPGALVVDPAGVLVTSYVRQASLAATSGTILTRPSAAGGQTSVLSALTLTGTASLDLADNNLILDGADAAAVTAATATLRGYLFNGGVTSSVAAADPQQRLAIGYATSAQLGVGTWGNQPVDATAVLTKMTYRGDANLDGKVNADDFALIDKGFAQQLSTWVFGDFNYDGTVNAADYLLIDRVYFQQTGVLSPSTLAAREAQFGDGYVSELLASVPEPSAAGGVVIAAASLFGRRRRRGD